VVIGIVVLFAEQHDISGRGHAHKLS